MGNLETVTNTLLQFLRQVGVMIWGLLTQFEVWLRDQLQLLGVAHSLQTVILIGVTILLVLAALRLFGGLIRLAVLLVLVLVVLHLVLPVIQN